jgi:hypothetical protein
MGRFFLGQMVRKNGAYDEIGSRSTIAELATLIPRFSDLSVEIIVVESSESELRACTPGQDQPAPIKGSIEDPPRHWSSG